MGLRRAGHELERIRRRSDLDLPRGRRRNRRRGYRGRCMRLVLGLTVCASIKTETRIE